MGNSVWPHVWFAVPDFPRQMSYLNPLPRLVWNYSIDLWLVQ